MTYVLAPSKEMAVFTAYLEERYPEGLADNSIHP
jgi:hypothetical protein